MMFGFKHNFWITEGHIFIFIGFFFLGVCESYNKKKSPKKSHFLNEEDDAKFVKK